ncbi:hypothetical protein FOL47_009744 [Perkinsus chesapeaki]|uniref:Dynein regulatory complex protein 12 n=1 Tax=Perkinsus chesapeaki TaxID=330153 RepID=A0A7J6N1T6_PERCH|nr:hypothetical protein FOL47_009744 [Perkinsus chesapeaki]
MGKKDANKEEPIGVPLKPEEMYEDLQNEVRAAELVLEERTRFAEDEIRKLEDYKREVDRVEEMLSTDRMITTSIVADHARSYKSLQDLLIQDINALETNLAELREDRDLCVNEMEELLIDKEDEFAVLDAQEKQIRDKIDDMASEFTSMMEELVTKLRHTIRTEIPETDGCSGSTAILAASANNENMRDIERSKLQMKAATFSKEMQQGLIEKMRCLDSPYEAYLEKRKGASEELGIYNDGRLMPLSQNDMTDNEVPPALVPLDPTDDEEVPLDARDPTDLSSQWHWHQAFRDTAKNMYRTNYHDMVNLREVAVRSDFPSGYAGHVPTLKHDILFKNTKLWQDFQHEFDRKDVDPVGVSCTEGNKREATITDRLPAFGGQKAGVPQFCANPRGANKIPREVFQKINGALAVKGGGIKTPYATTPAVRKPPSYRNVPPSPYYTE